MGRSPKVVLNTKCFLEVSTTNSVPFVISLMTTGKIIGIRIGTVVAFFTIGNITHFINKRFGAWFCHVYDKESLDISRS